MFIKLARSEGQRILLIRQRVRFGMPFSELALIIVVTVNMSVDTRTKVKIDAMF